jgi:DNA adenine methylase
MNKKMKMSPIRPPFKIHGGKYYLSKWIISKFPAEYEKMTYIEPFCGAASTLINKKMSVEEAINDIDIGIIKILRTIRDQCGDFVKCLKKIKYTKENFDLASLRNDFADELDAAINEIILRRMSRGGLKKAFSWSKRFRGGKPGDENAWETIITALPIISERLDKVYIFNKNAIDVLKAYNKDDVLTYIDPPYLPDTRNSTNVYQHEMTVNQHIELADYLKTFRGKVCLSGYQSVLYSKMYKNWRVEKKKIANHASQKKHKDTKEEILWLNY